MDTKRVFKKAVNLLTLSSFLVWNLSVAAPEGGSVAQGSATISQSGAQTTINQSSQNAVINWNSFNTASHEAVQFNQPNSSAVALNRITNGLPTQFAGTLNANGQVWILNPAGVLFTNTARVDVAGLIATTHGILDSNFMSGSYRFDLVPGSEYSSIINNGLISAKDSGIIALVAPHVANNGLIQANLGKVYLSSGASYTLDMYGDSLINFGSNAPIQNGSVSNAGKIIADGGKVYMTANYASGVLDNMISMTGTVQAKSVSVNKRGEIVLFGGNQSTKKLAGTTKVSGKLDTASEDNAVGGFIETSGYSVDLNGADIKTGIGGTWLLDPPTIYTSTWGSLISDQLNAGTNVTLSTGVSGSGDGDIYLDASITWNTSAILMLGAYRDINISAPVSATNNGRFIARADLSADGTGTVNFSGLGSVTVNGANGFAKLFYNPTGGNYATPTNYTLFLLGTAPQLQRAAYMMINTQADLVAAGLAGSSNILYSYALNNDIDGSVFSSTIFPGTFSGNFEGHDYATGLNHVIYNVNMSNVLSPFATTNYGRIENVGLLGSLTSTSVISGFVLANGSFASNHDATLSHVFFNGTITAGDTIGGLAYSNGGIIEYSYVTGTITQTGGALYTGGLVQQANDFGVIRDSYNAAAITGLGVGGIQGIVTAGITGYVFSNLYNVGFLDSTGWFPPAGGIAYNVSSASTSVSGLYVNTTTSNTPLGFSFSAVGDPSVPLNDAQMKIAANFPTFDFVNVWTTNGDTTYPQLRQNTMTINSTQFAGSVGASAAGQTVNIYADNILVGSAIVNGSGQYYINYNPNTVYAANPVIILATTSGANLNGDYLGKFYGPVGNLNIANNTVTVRSDTGSVIGNTNLAAQTQKGFYSVSSNNITMNSGLNFLTRAGIVYSSVFTTPNTPYNINGNITTSSSGNVTFNGPVTVGPSNWTVSSGGVTTFNSTVNDVSSGANNLIVNGTGGVIFNGIVGATPLANLTVTGATQINTTSITTTGNQLFNSAVTLGASPTLISNSGSILFGNTINGAFDLVTTAATLTTFSGIVGGTTPLTSLTVTGPATISTSGITTTGAQTYNNPITITITPTLRSNSGNILFNSAITNANTSSGVIVNAVVGTATFKGDINTQNVTIGSFTNITAPGGIIFAGSSPQTVSVYGTGSQAFHTFNGPITLQQDLTVAVGNSALQNILFNGTIMSDGVTPRSLSVFNFDNNNNSGTNLTFNGAIGGIGNLALQNLSTFYQGSTTAFNGSVTVIGNVNVHSEYVASGTSTNSITFAPGTTLLAAGSVQFVRGGGSNGNIGSINLNGALGTLANPLGSLAMDVTSVVSGSGVININSGVGSRIFVTGPESYIGPVNINNIAALQFDGSSVTFNGFDASHLGLVRAVGVATDITIPGNLILGTLGSIGQTAGQIPNSLSVTGASSIGGNIRTINNQTYTGATTLTASPTLTSTAGSILFGNTINGGFGLTTSVINSQSVTFNGAVGGTTALTSLTTSATGTTFINGGQVRTSSGAQNWNNPVFINADTILGGVGTTGAININTALDSANATPRALTLTTTAMTFLNGNLGATNILSGLTVTNAATLNVSGINTTSLQNYNGALTLTGNSNLFTNAGGTITFGSTIQGGFNLIANASSTGTVNFNNDIGTVGTPLTGLIVTGLANIAAAVGPTIFVSGTQTYNNNVSLNSIASLTFGSGIGSTTIFNGNVDRTGSSTALTIAGNLVVGNAGAIGQASSIASLTVNGTTAGVNVTTVGNQLYSGAYTLTEDDLLVSTSGSITFGSTVDGAFGLTARAMASGQAVVFNGVVGGTTPLTSLTLNNGGALGTTNINAASITTSGAQSYTNLLTIAANSVISSNSGGALNFAAINSLTSRSLTIASTGLTTFSGIVGSGGLLSTLVVNGPASFATATINASSSMTFNGPVTLAVGTIGLATNPLGSIVFGSTIDGASALTLDASTGTVTLNGVVGGITRLTNLLVISALNINAGVTGISTNNSQTYQRAVTLSPAAITFIGTTISFQGAVTGLSTAVNIGVTPTNITNLLSSVSVPITVQSLLVTGTSFVGGNITTTNGQTYRGVATTLASLTYADSSANGINFNDRLESTAAGTHVLTINESVGPVVFGNSVGSTNLFNSLTVTGPAGIQISGPVVRTVNNQLFNSPVVLGANSTLTSTSSDITFGGTINGASDLTVNANSGIVNFSGNVGLSVPLNTINVSAATIQNNGISITTTGAQNYTGNMRILNSTNGTFNTTLGGDITFNGVIGNSDNATIFSGNQLVTNSTGQVIFNDDVGIGAFGLAGVDLTASNGLVFNNVTVTTISSQVYRSPVILNGNVYFTTYIPSAVDFLSTVDSCAAGPGCLTPGSFSSLFNSINVFNVAPSIINFSGAIGSNNPLSSFSVYNINGPVTFNSTLDVAGPVSVIADAFYSNNLNTPPTITFNGAIGSLTPPTNFDVVSTSFFPAYDTSVIINSSLVATGAVTLTASSSGMRTVTFGGGIGTAINSLGSLTVNGGTAINFNSGVSPVVYVSGAEVFNGPVLINSNPGLQFNGTSVTFNGGLNSPSIASNVIIQNNLILSVGSSMGQTDPLNSLLVNGTTSMGGNIATLNNQTYTGAVTLTASDSLTSNTGNITFGSTINNNFDLGINAVEVRFKNVIGGISPLGALTVNANVINFDNAATSTTTTGIQTYNGTGINSLMTIGLDPLFTAPSFVIAIPLVILADTTYTSTAGNIDFQSTVDGPANLILNPTGTAIFQNDVGATTPLASLTVNGLLDISGATVINTDNNQFYGDLVTLNNNLVISAGTSGCSTTNCVQFTLGAIGVDGITGPGFDLSVYTYDASKGAAGDGIAGTVNVANFTMGGTGGGNVSPLLADFSTVGGSTAVGAWNNTVLDPLATGTYCVNGFCISGTRVLNIDASNDSKLYGQIITRNPLTDVSLITVTGLAPGDTVTSITLFSAGDVGTASVLGGPYAITASGASGAGLLNHYTSIVYNNAPGALTVNPALLTITSLQQIKTEGDFLPLTTAAFLPSGLQNGETVGTVDAASAGLSPAATPGVYLYTSVSNATGGTFDPTNYIINYVISGDITVLAGAPVNNFDIPPIEIFDFPTPVTCDGSGCNNLEMMIDNLVEAGVVTFGGMSESGCGFGFMQAQDTSGVVRILMPGDVVYAGDKILKDEKSCGCVKSLYTNKKVCMGPKNLGQVYKD